MAEQVLMESKDGERMNVPGDRVAEFEGKGWKVIERQALGAEQAAAPESAAPVQGRTPARRQAKAKAKAKAEEAQPESDEPDA